MKLRGDMYNKDSEGEKGARLTSLSYQRNGA